MLAWWQTDRETESGRERREEHHPIAGGQTKKDWEVIVWNRQKKMRQSVDIGDRDVIAISCLDGWAGLIWTTSHCYKLLSPLQPRSHLKHCIEHNRGKHVEEFLPFWFVGYYILPVAMHFSVLLLVENSEKERQKNAYCISISASHIKVTLIFKNTEMHGIKR